MVGTIPPRMHTNTLDFTRGWTKSGRMAFIQIERKFTGFSSYTNVIVHSEVSGGFEEPGAGLTNPAFLSHFSSQRSAG